MLPTDDICFLLNLHRWFPINATVVAVNSFPGTGSHEMALVPGDRIRVLEHYGLWYKGQHIVSGTMGVFPKVRSVAMAVVSYSTN